jgi:hypothetical protein
MKTTVEIADSLLREARRIASREGLTLKAMVEQGLRKVIDERGRSARKFHLRKASFKGHGLQAGVAEGGWERLRELAYEGRGG